MAPRAPRALTLTEVMSNLYAGAMQLVEVDRAITPEELALTGHLLEAIELARTTDHDRRAAIARLNGWGDTAHQERTERELKRDLARFRENHQRRINRLRSDVTRITVPLPRNMTACDRHSQTA